MNRRRSGSSACAAMAMSCVGPTTERRRQPAYFALLTVANIGFYRRPQRTRRTGFWVLRFGFWVAEFKGGIRVNSRQSAGNLLLPLSWVSCFSWLTTGHHPRHPRENQWSNWIKGMGLRYLRFPLGKPANTGWL